MEIAVVSGKGGTGKSSISGAFVTLAQTAVAVDCDVDAANMYLLFNPIIKEEYSFQSGKHALINPDICINCGICKELCRFDAISEKNDKMWVDKVACEGCMLCQKVCPSAAIKMVSDQESRMYVCDFRYGKMIYGRLAPGEENSGKFVNVIRQHAHRIEEECRTGIVILDGPPGIGCPVMSTLTDTDRTVIVTEPTISGLSDLQRIAEVAFNFTDAVYAIINKADLNKEMADKIKSYCEEVKIAVIAEIPFDKQVVDAMTNGKTVVEYAPQSVVASILRKAYQTIIADR